MLFADIVRIVETILTSSRKMLVLKEKHQTKPVEMFKLIMMELVPMGSNSLRMDSAETMTILLEQKESTLKIIVWLL